MSNLFGAVPRPSLSGSSDVATQVTEAKFHDNLFSSDQKIRLPHSWALSRRLAQTQ